MALIEWPETILCGLTLYRLHPTRDASDIEGALIFCPGDVFPILKVGPPVPGEPGCYYWDQGKPADQYGERICEDGSKSLDVTFNAAACLKYGRLYKKERSGARAI